METTDPVVGALRLSGSPKVRKLWSLLQPVEFRVKGLGVLGLGVWGFWVWGVWGFGGLGFRVEGFCLGTLGGTLNGDPVSLLGIIWAVPCYIGGI